jgi:hypothetical protein
MEIGNIVKPTKASGFILASGMSSYTDAVVISITPFILTSRESDMKWIATIKESNFEVIGTIDIKTLNHCKRRLE